MAKGENPYLFFCFTSFLLLASTVILQGLAWYTSGVDMGLFQSTLPHKWNKYKSDIIDTNWIFYIWSAVYFYQLVWFLYGFSLLCRRNGGYWLYSNPPLLSTAVYVVFGLGMAAILAWTVLWDWSIEVTFSRYSLLSAAVASGLFYIALAISVNSTREYRWMMAHLGQYSNIWDNRMFVQNGLALMASWMSIITVLCSVTFLSAAHILSTRNSEYVGLAMILAYVMTLMLLDIFRSGRTTFLYIFTPSLVSAATFVMVIYKNYYAQEDLLFELSAAFLGVAILSLLVKLIVILSRHRKGQTCTPSKPEEMVSIPANRVAEVEETGTSQLAAWETIDSL